MKKLIALLLLVVVLCSLLCACSTFTCDICGEEVTGKKHTYEAYGEKVNICDDCYDLVGEFLE